MADKDQDDRSVAAVERPEDKDVQDQTFGRKMAQREEAAERGEPDPGEETARHSAGKA